MELESIYRIFSLPFGVLHHGSIQLYILLGRSQEPSRLSQLRVHHQWRFLFHATTYVAVYINHHSFILHVGESPR